MCWGPGVTYLLKNLLPFSPAENNYWEKKKNLLKWSTLLFFLTFPLNDPPSTQPEGSITERIRIAWQECTEGKRADVQILTPEIGT